MNLMERISLPFAPTAAFLLGIVLVSFVSHVLYRNMHFQEGDSAIVYDALTNVPAQQLRAIAISYPKGSFISLETAHAILQIPVVEYIRRSYISSIDEQVIIERLSESTPLTLIRFAEVSVFSMIADSLPYPIRSMFALPFGTTYSAVNGLLYGVITWGTDGYEAFMSRALVITLFFSHMTVIGMYYILRRVGIADVSALIASIIALFSISLYSSGFHLGSTVWHFAAVTAWFVIVMYAYGKPFLEKTTAYISGALFFASYLIVIFWIGFVVAQCFWLKGSAAIRSFLFTQIPALLLMVLGMLLFYPPGQGARGESSLLDLPYNAYYVLLNFTAWYTHNDMLEIVQFSLAAGFLALGFYALCRHFFVDNSMGFLSRITFASLGVYVLFVLMGLLTFVPTRHVLFLYPVVIIFLGFGLQFAWARYARYFSMPSTMLLVITLVTLGFWSVSLRQDDTRDRSSVLRTDPSPYPVMIYDSSDNIYFALHERGLQASFFDPRALKSGQTYLYVSQSTTYDDAVADMENRYRLHFERIADSAEVTGTYFIAYNPRQYRFSRPNNLYQTVFRVTAPATEIEN